MAQKLVAVFLMCIVVLAAVHTSQSLGVETASKEAYGSCFNKCEQECKSKGNGYTLCEMKCDSACASEELKANLEQLIKS